MCMCIFFCTHASTVNKLLVSLQYTFFLGEPCRLLLLRVWGLGFRVVGRTFGIGIYDIFQIGTPKEIVGLLGCRVYASSLRTHPYFRPLLSLGW